MSVSTWISLTSVAKRRTAEMRRVSTWRGVLSFFLLLLPYFPNNNNTHRPTLHPTMTDPADDDNDIEAIYQLMEARAAGKATDESLEAAVARWAPAAAASSSSSKEQENDKQEPYEDEDEEDEEDEDDEEEDDEDNEKVTIKEDMGNYDEDDDDEDESNTKKRPREEQQQQQQQQAVESSDDEEYNEEAPVKRKRGRPRKEDAAKYKKQNPKVDWSAYADITFGKQGAQMLATFGDARQPRQETVRAALDATRVLVQSAMADARRVRDEFLNNYKNARSALRKHRPLAPARREEWSSELLYQAMVKNSRSHTAAEGCFTMQELKILYPEELYVYDRWRLMKEKAEKNKGDEDAATSNAEIDDNDGVDKEEADEEDEDKKLEEQKLEEFPASGHMAERCHQFDRRTDRMRKKRYLEFSEVRRGSFLGRITHKDADAAEGGAGKWARMAPIYLKFLLWCGLDPQSSIPPPNEPTTEALGFLAYNFLGRVVENAIRLRNEARKLKTGVVEVPKGDQLEVADIENAMKDKGVNPAPVFETSVVDGSVQLGTQLYFGPGFENRLEMELEAMVNAGKQKKKKNGQKEAQADDLLAQFAAPDLPVAAHNNNKSPADTERKDAATEKKGEVTRL